ncbi:hypothetical protein EVAR_40956_1 [Eumeta japonica]|uniref:Uncharacterized protein n=1 Tax=Eumeta variegata TaxID=151549 RepID=A0A4C1X3S4_EUMVA|nr:hypothetical protein EVAR_40956_1 [Eumeta japonica]
MMDLIDDGRAARAPAARGRGNWRVQRETRPPPRAPPAPPRVPYREQGRRPLRVCTSIGKSRERDDSIYSCTNETNESELRREFDNRRRLKARSFHDPGGGARGGAAISSGFDVPDAGRGSPEARATPRDRDTRADRLLHRVRLRCLILYSRGGHSTAAASLCPVTVRFPAIALRRC